ncbi:hypothetical protein FN846DRAFT_914514 [Sphaerosporella brunnea]|uniref:Uncharacterized protein n=1 Tax=Sphaerosporella brunnea TaxID=1250544 RepID=A0A5J5EBX7_9PEZI|nr:hypothetical protein FN846DRAFT_914514 [Sphaerosporella brunnea]
MAESGSIEACARADDAASEAPVAKGETPQAIVPSVDAADVVATAASDVEATVPSVDAADVVATAASDVEATVPSVDAADVVATAASDVEATVPSAPSITASMSRKAVRHARRIAQRKMARQLKKKGTGKTAVTPAPASVRKKTRSIFVDCSMHTSMEIAWKQSDSGSGVVVTFRGSPEVLPAPSRSPPQSADTAAEERTAAGMEAVRPEVATGSLPVTLTTLSLRPGDQASLLLREYLEWYIALVVDDPERVDSIKRAGNILMEQDFDLMTIQKLKGSEWLLLGITLGIGLALQEYIGAFLKSRPQGCRSH